MANVMMQPPQDMPQQMPAAAPQRGVPPSQMEPPPPQGADPLMEFTNRSRAAGIDIDAEMQKGGNPQEVLMRAMKNLWDKAPTDDTAEMLEAISGHLGIPPPWAQGQQEPPPPYAPSPLDGQPRPPAAPGNSMMRPPR